MKNDIKYQIEWQKAKIRTLPIELIDGDRSSRYPKRNELQKNGVLFLNTTNILDNRFDLSEANFISEEKYTQLSKGKLRPYDIVMTTRGSVGKVALFNHPKHKRGFINAQMLIIRVDGQIIHHKYLYYLLCNQNFQRSLRNFASGAAQPQIPIKDLREIEIDYPSLPTQRKIAAILSAYDDLIENNTRRIHILEKMAQAIYREWFVHFRFPGHEGVKLVESELGLIPEGWVVSTVENTFKILGGGTPSRKVAEYWENGAINWYTPSDLTKSQSLFMDDSSEKISELGLRKSSAKLFPPFSVMMTSRATLGVISINTSIACTNQGFITCIPGEQFPLYFLYNWLRENTDLFIQLGTGATYKEITKGVFKRIELAIPPISIVKRFHILVEPIHLMILNLQRKNKNLQKTRDLLLPRLISGELHVSDIKIQINEEVEI